MTAVTLIADLAVAVIAGIVFSALWFAWSAGGTLRVEPSLEPVPGIDAQDESGEEGDERGGAAGGRSPPRRCGGVITFLFGAGVWCQRGSAC